MPTDRKTSAPVCPRPGRALLLQLGAYESPNFLASSFKALDWDIDNQQGYAEAYKDVIHETQYGLARPQKLLITTSELAELEAIHYLQGGDVVVILVPLVDHERSRNSSPDGSK